LNGVTSAVKEPRNLVLAVMAVLDSVLRQPGGHPRDQDTNKISVRLGR
jgi:hypothetical protein